MLEVALDTFLQTFHLNLRFSATTGKTSVLLGESGSGKSSVLKYIAGLQHPHKGVVALNEAVYFDHERRIVVPPQERPFGYVFQDYVLFPHLSVFENVAFGLRAQHLSRATILQRTGEALEQVRLTGFNRRLPGQLSGGQQQRVAIARALALQPQLLLLDEPLSALDVQTRREVRQYLRQLLGDLQITTILVTHHYLDALLFGYQILVLEQGHILQQGDQHMLLQRPRSSYVAELVGTNFFQGRVLLKDAAALYTVQLRDRSGKYLEVQATSGEYAQDQSDLAVGEEAFVVVEPHSITLHTELPHSSARNTFGGEIMQMLPLSGGADTYSDGRMRVSILLAATSLPLTAELTMASVTQLELREGLSIYASFKATEARVYV